MIQFTFKKDQEAYKAMTELIEIVHRKLYPKTMIGPCTDALLLTYGIIIDGNSETVVADQLEAYLKKENIDYGRVKQVGEFYTMRDW